MNYWHNFFHSMTLPHQALLAPIKYIPCKPSIIFWKACVHSTTFTAHCFCSNGKLSFINSRWTMIGFLVMVSNVTFSNIPVISWRSVLLVGNPEYFRPVASHWQTLSHNDGQASIYLKNIYILISKTWYRIEWALNCILYQYNLYYVVFVVIGDHLFD